MMTERITQFTESIGISIRAFEQQIGASNGLIRKAITNKTDIQSKWLASIAENYPHINIEWLLTGKGEMLKENSSKHSFENKHFSDFIKEIKELSKENGVLKYENTMLKKELQELKERKNYPPVNKITAK